MAEYRVPPMEDGKFYHMIRKNTHSGDSSAACTRTTADCPAKAEYLLRALSQKSLGRTELITDRRDT